MSSTETKNLMCQVEGQIGSSWLFLLVFPYQLYENDKPISVMLPLYLTYEIVSFGTSIGTAHSLFLTIKLYFYGASGLILDLGFYTMSDW